MSTDSDDPTPIFTSGKTRVAAAVANGDMQGLFLTEGVIVNSARVYSAASG
jgi:hypothetical protein